MPANDKLIASLYERVRRADFDSDSGFSFIQDLCRVVNSAPTGPDAHELLLRSMDRRADLKQYEGVLDGLVRRIGLFPYLNAGDLSLADRLAFEAHRPYALGDDIVFHRAQAHVYHRILEGENVALSAPTSFGKSLIIDAVIASGKFNNIAIVVPTLALIDETHRRLAERFRQTFKIITHPGQQREERNLFILTQERVLDIDDWANLDFFVIDEFYKLDTRDNGDGRAGLLNQAFYRLAKTKAQFYMLGPSIEGITSQNHLRIELRFITEPTYHTVATEVHRVDAGGDAFATLVELARNLNSPTIVFCRSPARAAEVARQLAAANLPHGEIDKQAINWIAETYHPEWHVTQAFAAGIGVHHGRIPRALGQIIVRAFNDGTLPFLVCTSTLIEGVNTKARNIVVFDNQINRQRIDMFTFNNIKGRSGRMFEYFVGHVYVFHADPQPELPFVDVPALSQSENAPTSLLIQMDEVDLTDSSKERRRRFAEQQVLSFDVIRQNSGIDPEVQIAVATRIQGESRSYKSNLNWSGIPEYSQLVQICELIFQEFNGNRIGGGSAKTASQLAAVTMSMRSQRTTREMIENQRRFWSDFDEATERTLSLIRSWATFQLPRLLRVIGNIQRDVLTREGLPCGSYDYFAGQVENMFLDPGLTCVEEFGVPLDLARKISSELRSDDGIDGILSRMRSLDVSAQPLTNFEKSLLQNAIEAL
jgi:hypothetical protein